MAFRRTLNRAKKKPKADRHPLAHPDSIRAAAGWLLLQIAAAASSSHSSTPTFVIEFNPSLPPRQQLGLLGSISANGRVEPTINQGLLVSALDATLTAAGLRLPDYIGCEQQSLVRHFGSIYRGESTPTAQPAVLIPNGRGAAFRADGQKMAEGTFNDGMLDGEDCHVWHFPEASALLAPPIMQYSGGIRGGRREGFGRLQHLSAAGQPSGEEYEGEWVEGEMHGRGIMRFLNGERYEGEWAQNQRHGAGEQLYADGRRFSGQWVEGRMEGLGTLFAADGSIERKEQWKGGKLHGEDCFWQTARWLYTGSMRAGEFDGFGQLLAQQDCAISGLELQAGDSFSGEWRQGRPHGKGILLGADGAVKKSGEWEDGKLHGEGE